MNDRDLVNRFFEGTLTSDEEDLLQRRKRESAAVRVMVDALPRLAAENAREPESAWDWQVLRRARAERSKPNPVVRRIARLPLALAFATVMFAAGAWTGARSFGPASRSEPPAVEFVFADPYARSVNVVGDFNGWNPKLHAMEGRNGVWRLRLPLGTGVHEYQFVVDGRWVPDPTSASVVDDGFGRQNSVLYVQEVQSL